MAPGFERRSNRPSRDGRSARGGSRGRDFSSRKSSLGRRSSGSKASYRFDSDRKELGSPSDEGFVKKDQKFNNPKGLRRFNKDNQKRVLFEGEAGRRFAQRAGGRRSDPRLSNPEKGKYEIKQKTPPEAEIFGESPPKDLLWGRHTTQASLESGRPIHRIWCTAELRSSSRFLRLLREAKSRGVLVEEVTWARLGQLTGGAVHQGIVLQIAAAETLDLKSLIEGCSALNESPLLLALDGLTDPQNLGAIVRSAEAMGAHGLLLPQRRSAGLTGSVAKVAAGALEHLPVARVVNLNRSLVALKQAGYQVVGLADEGDKTLPEVDLEGPLVVVTGSEGEGLSLLTRRHCDHLVRIPLRGVTPSLNASVATAMFLYEVARRSWMKKLRGQDPSPRLVRAKCLSRKFDLNSEQNADRINHVLENDNEEDQLSLGESQSALD